MAYVFWAKVHGSSRGRDRNTMIVQLLILNALADQVSRAFKHRGPQPLQKTLRQVVQVNFMHGLALKVRFAPSN